MLQSTTNTIVENASFSTHARLLQFAEQSPIFNAMNFNYGCHNADLYGVLANSTACAATINMFLCPSATPPGYNAQKANAAAPFRAPGNSYFASVGSTLEWDATKTSGPPNGLFPYGGPPLGSRDVRDGTSNTIAFGEWRIGSGNTGIITIGSDIVWANSYPTGVTRNTLTVNLPMANAGNAFSKWLSACASQDVPGSANVWLYQGQTWAFGISTLSQGSACAAQPEISRLHGNGLGRRGRGRLVRVDKPPSRWRQLGLLRRFGPLPQGQHQHEHDLVARLERPKRGDRRQQFLTTGSGVSPDNNAQWADRAGKCASSEQYPWNDVNADSQGALVVCADSGPSALSSRVGTTFGAL